MLQQILEPESTVAACVPYGNKGHEEWIIAAVEEYDVYKNKYKVKDLYPESRKEASWILEPNKLTRFPNPNEKLVTGDRVLSLWFITEVNDWSSMFYDATVQRVEKNLVKLRFRGELHACKIPIDKVVKKPKTSKPTQPVIVTPVHLPLPSTSILNIYPQSYFPQPDIPEFLKNNNNSIKHARDDDDNEQLPNKKFKLPPLRILESMIINPLNTFTTPIATNSNDPDNKLPPLHINDNTDDLTTPTEVINSKKNNKPDENTLQVHTTHQQQQQQQDNINNNNNSSNNNKINDININLQYLNEIKSNSALQARLTHLASNENIVSDINILLTAIEGFRRETTANSFSLQPDPIPL